MKILFDTNTVLDLLLDREPFVDPVAQLFSLVERGDLLGCLGHEAARFTGADGIVTRDPKGFKKAEIRIYSPEELIQELIKSFGGGSLAVGV